MAELGRLLPRLEPDPTGAAARPLLIFAVTGMGGIGKTALAIETAHQACAEGWFPGGTLFVDLRGYDDNPVTADQAVLALLDALGVRGSELPSTAARQYDTYRTLLAERRDRTLLILDNASDPAQYLPLLPGTDLHRVLITSRDRPDSLTGIRLIDLETLPEDDSVALITRALHDADERDERPAREPDALHELAALCGHLPLALHISAAMLRRRRTRGITSLVTEITQAGDPTVTLDNGTSGTDQYGRCLVLRPVLETSYCRLPHDQARLLRLLSIAPGAETGTEAVAALVATDSETALGLLESLAAACLVTPILVSGVVRWRLHDLVRAYGAGVVAQDAELMEESEVARARLLEFYRQWTSAADYRLRWLPGMAEPQQFTDRASALSWLDGERAGLIAAVQWAPDERYTGLAVQLAISLGVYLEWRRHFDDWATVSRVAAQAAHRRGDRRAEATAWVELGGALRVTGQVAEAIDALTRACKLFQATEEHHREGMAWDNLGVALRDAGRVEEAIKAHTRARKLFQAAGDRRREAIAWGNLGNALYKAGRVEKAIDALAHARNLHRADGDRLREGIAWSNLAAPLLAAGRGAEAIEACGRALELYQEFEDWYRIGQALTNLALAHKAAHRPAEARTYWLQAADAYTRADATAQAAQTRARAEEQQ